MFKKYACTMQHDQSDCAAAVVSTVLLSYKNILRLVVKKSPTGESTHYFFHSQDDKVEVSC